MKVVSNYQETIDHYDMKLSYAQDEWESAMKEMAEIAMLLETEWAGKASSEAVLKLQGFKNGANRPKGYMEEVRSNLAQLGVAIEEELKKMELEAGDTDSE